MIQIDKRRVFEMLRARVAETLASVVESQKVAQVGAIHEETRAEDPKDMRSTEASYLARGLAQRADELQTEASRLSGLSLHAFGPDDPIDLSALVGLEDEAGRRSILFIVAAGAGESLEVDGHSILPVTLASPLGRAVAGAHAGDSVEVELPGGMQERTILWVA